MINTKYMSLLNSITINHINIIKVVTLRVKPLTWGHGPNFGLPGIWVVTEVVLASDVARLDAPRAVRALPTRVMQRLLWLRLHPTRV